MDIHLSNGQIIIYSLNDKKDDPQFADILSGNYKESTLTDGENIYWTNGVSISLDEIFDSLIDSNTRMKLAHRWRTATISIGLVAVAVVFAVLAFSPFLFSENTPTQFDDPMIPMAAAPDADPGQIFPIDHSVTIPADSTHLEIVLKNPENSNSYLVFEILIDNKLLAASEMISPGSYIESLRLAEPLAKGEYEAVLNARMYDSGSHVETGLLSIVIVVNVT